MKRHCGFIWWLVFLRHIDRAAFRAGRGAAINHERILVVRLDGIGDFILWLDAARQLRRKYPAGSYRITLVANRLWAALAREQPYFDEVWEIDLKRFVLNPGYRYRILRRLAAAGFGMAINPTFSRDFLWGDAMMRVSR